MPVHREMGAEARTNIVLYAVAGAELHKLAACVQEGFAVSNIGNRQEAAKQYRHSECGPCGSRRLFNQYPDQRNCRVAH